MTAIVPVRAVLTDSVCELAYGTFGSVRWHAEHRGSRHIQPVIVGIVGRVWESVKRRVVLLDICIARDKPATTISMTQLAFSHAVCIVFTNIAPETLTRWVVAWLACSVRRIEKYICIWTIITPQPLPSDQSKREKKTCSRSSELCTALTQRIRDESAVPIESNIYTENINKITFFFSNQKRNVAVDTCQDGQFAGKKRIISHATQDLMRLQLK